MGVGGLDFAAAFGRAVETTYGGIPIRVLSFSDLVTAKRAAGRDQDLLDLRLLEKARSKKTKEV